MATSFLKISGKFLKAFLAVSILALGTSEPARADCQVVGRYDNGEPVVECNEDYVDDSDLLQAEICDPRVVGDCYGNRNPNPRPYSNQRNRLPYRGGVPGPAAGDAPRNAAGLAPFGAAGSPPRATTGR